KLLGQYIDDQTQFYLPVPLDGPTRSRLRGNDGEIVNSVQNQFDSSTLGFATPGGGRFSSEINEGVSTKGGMFGLAFDKDFGDSGWAVNGRIKYSKYQHSLGVPANAQFTFGGGAAVPANSLLFANRFTDRDRPVDDFTAEFNLTKSLATGSVDHALTLGGFYGNATAGDFNVTTTYLAEFNNRPRLVNLTVNPAPGTQTVVSRAGLLNAGAGYVNNEHSAERFAGYI
ncbi:MAG: TonB-dependent receptor, partial [Alphaproteobacteria bacterium PA3]